MCHQHPQPVLLCYLTPFVGHLSDLFYAECSIFTLGREKFTVTHDCVPLLPFLHKCILFEYSHSNDTCTCAQEQDSGARLAGLAWGLQMAGGTRWFRWRAIFTCTTRYGHSSSTPPSPSPNISPVPTPHDGLSAVSKAREVPWRVRTQTKAIKEKVGRFWQNFSAFTNSTGKKRLQKVEC